jgi:hypothetical protein
VGGKREITSPTATRRYDGLLSTLPLGALMPASARRRSAWPAALLFNRLFTVGIGRSQRPVNEELIFKSETLFTG